MIACLGMIKIIITSKLRQWHVLATIVYIFLHKPEAFSLLQSQIVTSIYDCDFVWLWKKRVVVPP